MVAFEGAESLVLFLVFIIDPDGHGIFGQFQKVLLLKNSFYMMASCALSGLCLHFPAMVQIIILKREFMLDLVVCADCCNPMGGLKPLTVWPRVSQAVQDLRE